MAEISLSVDVDAAPAAVWAAMVDWDRQGEWMMLTHVSGSHGVGAPVSARTGIGRAGFVDSMTITDWQPPHRCAVVHTGKVVRGTAAFEVEPLPGGRSRFVWSEWVLLPLGVVGRIGFRLVRPLVVAGLRHSLRKFARWAPARAGEPTDAL
jgi:hypothetical protein